MLTNSPDDARHMRHALDLARKSLTASELPVGAIVVINGVVRGTGWKDRSSPFLLDHAEMHAISAAVNHLHQENIHATVYTTLEPCAMCFGTLLHTHMDRVVFALEDPHGGATRMRCKHMPPRHNLDDVEIQGGMLREESHRLFMEFFRKTTNPYWQDQNNPLGKLCSP